MNHNESYYAANAAFWIKIYLNRHIAEGEPESAALLTAWTLYNESHRKPEAGTFSAEQLQYIHDLTFDSTEVRTFNFYNIYDQVIKSIQYQIKNGEFIVFQDGSEARRKIKNDPSGEFTYSFKKTIVKAANGAEGLIRHFRDSERTDSAFNTVSYGILEGLVKGESA